MPPTPRHTFSDSSAFTVVMLLCALRPTVHNHLTITHCFCCCVLCIQQYKQRIQTVETTNPGSAQIARGTINLLPACLIEVTLTNGLLGFMEIASQITNGQQILKNYEAPSTINTNKPKLSETIRMFFENTHH